MTSEKIKFIILRTLGNFFVIFSMWGMLMTFGPAFYFEILYRYNQARNVTFIVSYPTPTYVPGIPVPTTISTPTPVGKSTFFGQFAEGNKVEELSPVSAQFGLIIPKIGANAPIVPNVDAGNPSEYLPSLQQGIAHAAGTKFPGVGGNIFLFAHSTDSFWNVGRYNAVFYLLKELNSGDEIDVFFNGVRHIYRVVDKKIVDPTEVYYLTQTTPYEQLILQTCWPPGTTLKRLLVFARPEKDLAFSD
jgi:sortase A